MRYKLFTDRSVNQLTPHYLPGRKYILFLQSLVYPLQTLNERFIEFTEEKHIEARMTSQVIYFEWYLNHKFNKYLSDKKDKICIKESTTVGVDIYHEGVTGKPYTLWKEGEIIDTQNELEKPREFYFLSEEKAINKVSFMVCVPEINIEEQEFVYILSYVVNRYKLAGKTYLIKINSKEIEPNTRITT
ncbi:hypothetical protein IR083_07265 [Dysgonomonas sp. GY75]|uniref:hypothetical protein n=1 Tax=Dysgonomonas sp. GY75 TaxID=2780419 RepID=UPI00188437C9|nr:hypothetical protein [Dysgonomonas sp. GY75]MBF0648614.1 hypothetical protein [Dysgonomonas sp. GY75]